MFIQSFLGSNGVGYSKSTIEVAQFRRFGQHEYGNPNWNAGHVHTDTITPLSQQESSTLQDKLGYLHKKAQVANTIDGQKRMYRTDPWGSQIEKQQRVDPRFNARIYADDAGRNLAKNVVHGFRSNLVPEAKLTNKENQLDERSGRLGGEVEFTQAQQQQKRVQQEQPQPAAREAEAVQVEAQMEERDRESEQM